MYYRRRFPMRKRRVYRRKVKPGFLSKAGGYLSTATKALSLARYLKSIVNVERKVFDVTIAQNPTNAVLSYSALNAIAQGDTQNTRSGNEMKNQSLQVSMTITGNSSNAATTVRCILIRDMESLPGGSGPTVTGLLQNPSFPILSPLAIQNANAGNRYQVLKDKVYELVTASPNFIKTIKWYIKLSDHSRYVGPNNTDVVSPVYYLCFMSDQGTNLPAVLGYTRLRFTDN